MSGITLEITKKQVREALNQLPVKEARNLLLDFFKKGSTGTHTFREVQKEISTHVRKHKIPHSVVEEAIQWARSKQ
jgi:hypothetical protein